MESLSTKPPPKEIIVKQEPSATPPSPVRPAPASTKTHQSSSQTEKAAKPRLSLVERQSLMNASRTSDAPVKKRRISNLHDPLPNPSTQLLKSSDIFRFPSESPPKQPVKTAPKAAPRTTSSSDKENTAPSWPQNISGRERRRTFNVTMEKLARMTQEELQADTDWEANLSKRRRQSVAI